jgi:short-subunit dehydrogenase
VSWATLQLFVGRAIMTDRLAVITGATSGIGAAYAKAFV